MNRTVHTYQIKTLSQYPFLIGEILRRAEQRRVRRAKRGTLFRKLNGLNTLTTFKDRVSAPENSHRCAAPTSFEAASAEHGKTEEKSY